MITESFQFFRQLSLLYLYVFGWHFLHIPRGEISFVHLHMYIMILFNPFHISFPSFLSSSQSPTYIPLIFYISSWYPILTSPTSFPYFALVATYERKDSNLDFLSLASFTWHDFLHFNPLTGKCHYFILLYDWIKLHCVSIPHFPYPFHLFTGTWADSITLQLWIAQLWTDVPVSLYCTDFSFGGKYQGMGCWVMGWFHS